MKKLLGLSLLAFSLSSARAYAFWEGIFGKSEGEMPRGLPLIVVLVIIFFTMGGTLRWLLKWHRAMKEEDGDESRPKTGFWLFVGILVVLGIAFAAIVIASLL